MADVPPDDGLAAAVIVRLDPINAKVLRAMLADLRVASVARDYFAGDVALKELMRQLPP